MVWMAAQYQHPVLYVQGGAGARFTDVDGHEYIDMNLADSSAFCGFAPPAVVDAVARRVRRGSQFLLADEDAVFVAETLARRFGLPKWQLTLSASHANTEAIRLSRAVTGRHRVLVFDGKYHGLLDETLAVVDNGRTVPEYVGLSRSAVADCVLVEFNDVAAVRYALEGREVACVLTEPALTNQGIVPPEEGFHGALRAACRETGTVLIIDEAHTLPCGPGGLTRSWGLVPDIVTLGKSIGGGVPVGAYGMTNAIADVLHQPELPNSLLGGPQGEVATGGTFCGCALQTAACRAALEHVLTDEAYGRATRLCARLADGVRANIRAAGLPWSVQCLPTKMGYRPHVASPRTAAEARRASWPELSTAVRLWFANRGVWDAGWWSGPAVSVATTEADVDLYLARFSELLGELSG